MADERCIALHLSGFRDDGEAGQQAKRDSLACVELPLRISIAMLCMGFLGLRPWDCLDANWLTSATWLLFEADAGKTPSWGLRGRDGGNAWIHL